LSRKRGAGDSDSEGHPNKKGNHQEDSPGDDRGKRQRIDEEFDRTVDQSPAPNTYAPQDGAVKPPTTTHGYQSPPPNYFSQGEFQSPAHEYSRQYYPNPASVSNSPYSMMNTGHNEPGSYSHAAQVYGQSQRPLSNMVWGPPPNSSGLPSNGSGLASNGNGLPLQGNSLTLQANGLSDYHYPSNNAHDGPEATDERRQLAAASLSSLSVQPVNGQEISFPSSENDYYYTANGTGANLTSTAHPNVGFPAIPRPHETFAMSAPKSRYQEKLEAELAKAHESLTTSMPPFESS